MFIQSNRTKAFYAGDGTWRPTRAQAMELGTSIRAERIAAQDKLEDVSLVLTFESGRNTVLIPLSLSFSVHGAVTRTQSEESPRN